MPKLRIEYSVECVECDQKQFADLTITSTEAARRDFQDDGWIATTDGDAICPACAEEE